MNYTNTLVGVLSGAIAQDDMVIQKAVRGASGPLGDMSDTVLENIERRDFLTAVKNMYTANEVEASGSVYTQAHSQNHLEQVLDGEVPVAIMPRASETIAFYVGNNGLVEVPLGAPSLSTEQVKDMKAEVPGYKSTEFLPLR